MALLAHPSCAFDFFPLVRGLKVASRPSAVDFCSPWALLPPPDHLLAFEKHSTRNGMIESTRLELEPVVLYNARISDKEYCNTATINNGLLSRDKIRQDNRERESATSRTPVPILSAGRIVARFGFYTIASRSLFFSFPYLFFFYYYMEIFRPLVAMHAPPPNRLNMCFHRDLLDRTVSFEVRRLYFILSSLALATLYFISGRMCCWVK